MNLRALAVKALIVACVAAVYIGVRTSYDVPFRGDEPHYLVVTNSLIRDGDFDVRNDYTDHRYLPYYPYLIDPHVNFSIFSESSPHWYPVHGVGLSVFLVPFVKAWGVHAGSKAAMVLVAVACVLLTHAWARRFVTSEVAAWAAALTLGLSPAFLGLEGRIFPDLLSATLLVGCLMIVETRRRSAAQLLALGVMVGVSPWIHFKTLLAFASAGALVAFEVLRANEPVRRRLGRAALVAGPAALSVLWLAVVSHRWYGSWSPASSFPPGNEVFALWPSTGIVASAFDATKGLLTSSPALLLVLFGLPIWVRRHRYSVLKVAAIVGPTVVLHATFNDWSGGYAPLGRYALQFLPALVPAAAVALDAPRTLARVGAAAVAIVVQSWLAIRFVLLKPAWTIAGMANPLYSDPKGIRIHFDRWMPHFDAKGRVSAGVGWLLAWEGLALILLIAGARAAGMGRGGGTPPADSPARPDSVAV